MNGITKNRMREIKIKNHQMILYFHNLISLKNKDFKMKMIMDPKMKMQMEMEMRKKAFLKVKKMKKILKKYLCESQQG